LRHRLMMLLLGDSGHRRREAMMGMKKGGKRRGDALLRLEKR
jgi:hypothetical protein